MSEHWWIRGPAHFWRRREGPSAWRLLQGEREKTCVGIDRSHASRGEGKKLLVPEARLELAQAEARGILSPLRLPVPPLRHAHILSFPLLSWQALFQSGLL
jgi:hypothetical protein